MHSFRSTLDFDSGKVGPQNVHSWNLRRQHTYYIQDKFVELWNDKSLQLEFSKPSLCYFS